MNSNNKNRIIGAVIGDIVGSTFEFANRPPNKFKLQRSGCTDFGRSFRSWKQRRKNDPHATNNSNILLPKVFRAIIDAQ